ncbi:protein kinase-like domain protein [Verticillium dahliae]
MGPVGSTSIPHEVPTLMVRASARSNECPRKFSNLFALPKRSTPSTRAHAMVYSQGIIPQLWEVVRYFANRAYQALARAFRGLIPNTDFQLSKLPGSSFGGSTAVFFQVQPNIILKAPVRVLQDQTIQPQSDVSGKFQNERLILERLGRHPLIIGYLGWRPEFPTGLLFAEASQGSLQRVLHEHDATISLALRRRWFHQAIRAIEYIHSRGIIHSDLRPDNFLVHGPLLESSDLQLCDFGGSTCRDLEIIGNQLPDAGFFNPRLPWTPTPDVDIFSLGSILYTVVVGHWPFRQSCAHFETLEEMDEYGSLVDDKFSQGIYPAMEGVFGQDIILGCWTRRFVSAEEIVTEASKLKYKEQCIRLLSSSSV